MAGKKHDPAADFRGTVIEPDALLDGPIGSPETAPEVEAAPEIPPEPPVPPLEEEKNTVNVATSPMPTGVWQVRARTTISWSTAMGTSQMITLNPGDEISDAHYGTDSVNRMRAAGVPMELVG